MNIWITIGLITAGFVFLIDYLLRRKKWKDNTKEEKISLIIQMISISPYMFSSALGVLWGIAGGSPETEFGNLVYDVTLSLAAFNFIVAIVAVIATFILRKIGKTKASIWINILAFVYMIVVFAVNSFAGEWL